MHLRLKAIKFNHDSASANVDALNIRRNENQPVDVPEWSNVSADPADSPAVYARRETQGKTITIHANFSGDLVEEVFIRAIDPHTHHDLPVNGNLSSIELQLLQSVTPQSEGNVLGQVRSTAVRISRGETGFQSFVLDNIHIGNTGIGVDDIVWRWQFSVVEPGHWIDFAVTTHRIYTILSMPGPPWRTNCHGPSNFHPLWTDVLDHACAWAAGATNPDIAAEMITQRIHDLGPSTIRYTGSAFYTNAATFHCNSFLERLAGQIGRGKRVNCDDCATIVSTFANAVGCNLSQMCIRPVGQNFFGLKPHFRIGIPRLKNRSFFHHEVASEGKCGEEDEVFDACLRLDDPHGPGVFTVPTNLRFGSQNGYRFRLIVSQDQPVTEPTPCKQRSLVMTSAQAGSCVSRPLLEEHFQFESWKRSNAPGTRRFLSDFFFTHYILPNLQLTGVQTTSASAGVIRNTSHSFWTFQPGVDEPLLRVDVHEAASWQDARETLMTILTTLSEPGMVWQQHADDMGDVVFADPDFEDILLAVGNLVFFLRNAGFESVSLIEAAKSINQSVLNAPPGSSDPFIPDTIRQFRFASDKAIANNKIRLIETPPQLHSPKRLYQFIADEGEVSLEEEGLMYLPKLPGSRTLNIFAADTKGDFVIQTLPLNVTQQ